jgi:hypothetical protein
MTTAVFVAKLSIGRMVHCPDDRKPIGPLSQPWQVFAEMDTRNHGLRRAVFAANSIGRFGLGIESFVLRGPAGLKNEND